MKYQGFIWAGIYVQDLETSVAFYRDELGLRLLDRGEDWAHFDAGIGTLLELFTRGRSVRGPKSPQEQSIVLGLRVEDLGSAVNELTHRGVQFIAGESGEYEGARWAHFYDVEGNRLEVKEIP
jgi:metallothiol transferase